MPQSPTFITPPRTCNSPPPTQVQAITPYRHHKLFALSNGDMLAEYRIERPLGRGGMGVVYSAWDTLADRPVAIKVLGWAITEPRLIARFRREATLPTRLHHPGIVEVYGIGQTADICFLIMQRVDGISLRDWMNASRGPSSDVRLVSQLPTIDQPTQQFSIRFDGSPIAGSTKIDESELKSNPAVIAEPGRIRRVAEMLREVADALAVAHSAGVTHRDVKPENVIVKADGQVVLIDFGLARAFADTTLTSCSGLIGTPLYMAPEQLSGKPASSQSDVYALGLIGYELLAGAVPYQSGSVERLLDEVLHKPIPPLTARNPAVPSELANIIHKATAKNPCDRYASAAEMRADLDQFLSNKQVSACKYRYRFESRDLIAVRPRRVSVAAYSVALLGGAICIYGLFSAAFKSDPSVLKITLIGALFIAAALRLFSGRSGAKALGYVVAFLLLAEIGWLISQLFTPETRQVSPVIIAIILSWPSTVAALLFTALLSPSTREWMSRVQAKRREYAAECKPRT